MKEHSDYIIGAKKLVKYVALVISSLKLVLFYFFSVAGNLNSEPQKAKTSTLPLSHILNPLYFYFEQGLAKFLRLALNLQYSSLNLLNSWDYSCVPHQDYREFKIQDSSI